MKPITVYCAFCHRPQAGQRHLPPLTWACRRDLAFKRQLLGFVKAADGVEIPTYVLVNDDGAQQCTSVLDGAA